MAARKSSLRDLAAKSRKDGLAAANTGPVAGRIAELDPAIVHAGGLDDTAAALHDVPVAKAQLGQRKAFMQALISGQAITEFDRPSSKAVGEIKALFREVQSRLR